LEQLLAKEQDCLAWEKELQQEQEELEQLNKQIMSKTNVEAEVDENERKMLSLKSELAAYMGNKLSYQAGMVQEQSSDEAKGISRSIKQALVSKRKELDEYREKFENAKTEATLLIPDHVFQVLAQQHMTKLCWTKFRP